MTHSIQASNASLTTGAVQRTLVYTAATRSVSSKWGPAAQFRQSSWTAQHGSETGILCSNS